MLWYNGDIKNPVLQAERLSVISEGGKEMKKIFFAVIAVIVILAGGLMLSYNGLAGSKEAVETAEADVDTMLQRRADLIPNLVSTVKVTRSMRRGC